MTLFIAADHAGFAMKEAIKASYQAMQDQGAYTEDASDDYVDFAVKLCQAMQVEDDKGILLCGSGVGMNIVANRFHHIRAALCYTVEQVILARQHDDANVLCLGARFLDTENGIRIAEAFLKTSFSEEERHVRRLRKIDNIK